MSGPDYIVLSISSAASAVLGALYRFSYVVKNQGTDGASSTSWAAAYLDQQVTAFPDSWNLTNALAAGATQSLSNSISTTGLSLGVHTLWIKADNFNDSNSQFNSGNNDVVESDETNNWLSVSFTVTAPPQPDYVVSGITAGASVSQGSVFNFSYVVTNQGTGAASTTSWAAAYLDQQVTAFTNSWNVTSALGSGATQTLSNSISTAGLSLGTHTLWIKADNFNDSNGQFNSGNNDIVESDETNNWLSVSFTVTAPQQPDYVVSSITAGASVSQGSAFNFSYAVTNQGTGAASSTSWAAAYLDQQVTAFTSSWNVTSALGSGATQTLSNSISTAGLSLGTHTLWIKADNFNDSNGQFNSGNNDIVESDETNNWRSVSFTVTAPVPPDLVVSSISTAASLPQGSTLSFSYVVKNQGSGPALSTSWGAAYLDQQVTPVANSWNQTSALAAGATQTLSNSISTTGLSLGVHTLWIKTDNFNDSNGQFNSGNNDVVESDETNNWRSVNFTVTTPVLPDYVVSSITTASTVIQGSNLSFSYVLTNQGAAASTTSWGAAYIDQQVTPVPNSWNLTNALGPGGTQTLSNSINTAGLSVGTHTLWIEADNFNSSNNQFNSGYNNVVESNETNNWRSVTFNVTAAPASNFNIAVSYSGDTTYQHYFIDAAARWQQIILADLPDVNSATYGFIDDLKIDASVVAIDGAGNILGQAGPDAFRSGSRLPYHGVMQFDSADLANMAANGTLLQVILHEMGHVLGLGTLWSTLGLKSGFQYIGANALAEYRTLSGNASATSVPLETGGGSGTAGSHWSEAVFGNELMTGYIAGIPDPLSRMTVGALQDLGYVVNYGAADPYTMPGHLVADASGNGSGSTASIVGSTGLADDPESNALTIYGNESSFIETIYAPGALAVLPMISVANLVSSNLPADNTAPAITASSDASPAVAANDMPTPATIAQLGSFIASTFAAADASSTPQITPEIANQPILAAAHA